MNNNFSDMDRVNRIWRHPVYQEHYKKIQELESERIFCRHTPEHFLDVARLMYTGGTSGVAQRAYLCSSTSS